MDGVNFDLSKIKNGVLLVDKPQDWTSFDVVAKIRGQIRAGYRARGEKPTKRQQKVGHAGTLDPFATGLLVVLLGDTTKKADEFLKLDKVYEATIRLGQTSTTGDPEGELTDVSSLEPSLADTEQTIGKFIGDITQIPPKFSAIKINGQRAYKLAHKGLDVEIPSRQVVIYSIEILEYAYPELRIRAHVSSGTYIRTLAEDIGNELHTGAYCSQLRRTRVGRWSIDDTVKGEPND